MWVSERSRPWSRTGLSRRPARPRLCAAGGVPLLHRPALRHPPRAGGAAQRRDEGVALLHEGQTRYGSLSTVFCSPSRALCPDLRDRRGRRGPAWERESGTCMPCRCCPLASICLPFSASRRAECPLGVASRRRTRRCGELCESQWRHCASSPSQRTRAGCRPIVTPVAHGSAVLVQNNRESHSLRLPAVRGSSDELFRQTPVIPPQLSCVKGPTYMLRPMHR